MERDHWAGRSIL